MLILSVQAGERIVIGEARLLVVGAVGAALVCRLSDVRVELGEVARLIDGAWVSASRSKGRWRLKLQAPQDVRITKVA